MVRGRIRLQPKALSGRIIAGAVHPADEKQRRNVRCSCEYLAELFGVFLDLNSNADGSVDLYLQNTSPGLDKESNRLPAPPDKFIPMLRMYWPSDKNPSILDNSSF